MFAVLVCWFVVGGWLLNNMVTWYVREWLKGN